jgi:hypothetical protein
MIPRTGDEGKIDRDEWEGRGERVSPILPKTIYAVTLPSRIHDVYERGDVLMSSRDVFLRMQVFANG